MELYLMQHGVCYSKDVNPDQPLTPMGAEQVELTATMARSMGLRLDAIVSSPKTRAFETAKIMARGLGYAREDIYVSEELKAMAPPRQSWDFLSRIPDTRRMLAVGHLPNLVELTSLLVCRGHNLALNMENSSLLRLDVLDKERPTATLMWYLPQSMLTPVSGLRRGMRS